MLAKNAYFTKEAHVFQDNNCLLPFVIRIATGRIRKPTCSDLEPGAVILAIGPARKQRVHPLAEPAAKRRLQRAGDEAPADGLVIVMNKIQEFSRHEQTALVEF